MQYIVAMKKKQEVLFNFWLAEKNTKTYETEFSNQRQREWKMKVEVGEITSQNNGE